MRMTSGSNTDPLPLLVTPTDAATIVQGVLAALDPTIKERDATVTVGPLPVVQAEPTQLIPGLPEPDQQRTKIHRPHRSATHRDISRTRRRSLAVRGRDTLTTHRINATTPGLATPEQNANQQVSPQWVAS